MSISAGRTTYAQPCVSGETKRHFRVSRLLGRALAYLREKVTGVTGPVSG
jgi:hypothetical protein